MTSRTSRVLKPTPLPGPPPFPQSVSCDTAGQGDLVVACEPFDCDRCSGTGKYTFLVEDGRATRRKCPHCAWRGRLGCGIASWRDIKPGCVGRIVKVTDGSFSVEFRILNRKGKLRKTYVRSVAKNELSYLRYQHAKYRKQDRVAIRGAAKWRGHEGTVTGYKDGKVLVRPDGSSKTRSFEGHVVSAAQCGLDSLPARTRVFVEVPISGFDYHLSNTRVLLECSNRRYARHKYPIEIVAGTQKNLEAFRSCSIAFVVGKPRETAKTMTGPATARHWLKNVSRGQMLFYMPGTATISQKVVTAYALRAGLAFYPDIFKYIYPETFVYPVEADILKRRMDSNPEHSWIVKPNKGSEGRGIVLTKSFLQIKKQHEKRYRKDNKKSYVVQRYIDNPMTTRSKKFDLRLYVALTSLDPLRVYVCREGLVRVCTNTYSKPDKKDVNDTFAHLTNYSVNKRHWKFKQSADPKGKGSDKQAVSGFMKHLKREGVDTKRLWAAIDQLVAKTFGIFGELFKVSCRSKGTSHALEGGCFKKVGFDVLLTTDYKAYLMELNSAPSEDIRGANGSTSPVDETVKGKMMLDLLTLLIEQQAGEAKPGESGTWVQVIEQHDPVRTLYARLGDIYHRLTGSTSCPGIEDYHLLLENLVGRFAQEDAIVLNSIVENVEKDRASKRSFDSGKSDKAVLDFMEFVCTLQEISAKIFPEISLVEGVDNILSANGM